MSSTARLRALTLAVLMVASSIVIAVPEPALGQGDDDVPVSYQPLPGMDTVTLHFWRDDNPDRCNPVAADQDPTESIQPSFCALRIDAPPADGSKSEIRNVTNNPDNPQEGQIVRFILDTQRGDDEGEVGAQPAKFPFTIKSGVDAVRTLFHYDSQAVCQEIGGSPQGQVLDFHLRLREATPSDPTQGSPFSTTVVEDVCDAPSGSLSDEDANQLTAGFDLSEARTINKGNVLVVEIFAVSANFEDRSVQWSVIFEDPSFDSRVEIRTDQGLEHAVWATDRGNNHKTSFDPNAPSEQRYVVGQLALRSPFGPSAIPASGFKGQVLGPGGTPVDIVTDQEDNQTSIDLDERRGLREANGARKIFKFTDAPGGNEDRDQPWHYERGQAAGAYTVSMTGALLGKSRQMQTTIAMGAFQFSVGPVDGEQTTHQVLADTSTTFLLELENGPTTSDTFEVDATFTAPTTGDPWGVDFSGVDQNDRVSLQPDERGLLQVTLTPPSSASEGDAARVEVTVTSQASSSTKTLNLEAQITTTTVRDAGLVVLGGSDDRLPVRIDRDTPIRGVFVWNQGTATDSFDATVVQDSLVSDKPGQFSVNVDQGAFPEVAPGAVARIPITVTTGPDVVEGDTFDFDIRVTSQSNTDATARRTVQTIVDAQRSFDLFALDGQNTRALESVRYGKWNMSDEAATDPRDLCERGSDDINDSLCGEYTTHAYHRLVLTNTGDQPETFDLTTLGGQERFTVSDPPNDVCTSVLEDRLWSTSLVREIDHSAPGTESSISTLDLDPGSTARFYLRVSYDGETAYHQAPAGDCRSEAHHLPVRASIQGATDVTSKVIDTTTRVFNVLPNDGDDDTNDDMPRAAKGTLSLEPQFRRGGLLRELPSLNGVSADENETIPFTVSLQSGHPDRVRVHVEPQDTVQELRDDGWRIELTSLDTEAKNLSDTRLRIPTDENLDRTVANITGHASGADYTLGLIVRPPETGVQENERHTFTIVAETLYEDDAFNGASDTMGIRVQVGEDFAFKVDQGLEEIQAHPGDTVAFGLTVENVGASRDRYTIQAEAPSAFQEPSVRPSRMSVSPGSEKASSIEVTVPEGTAAGPQTINAAVVAEGPTDDPSDDIPSREIRYTVDVEPAGDLQVSANQSTISIGPGGDESVEFTIQNSGSEDTTVDITELFAPEGWVTTLTDNDQGARVTVPDGGSNTFTYLVEAPDDIVEGSRYTFLIRAEDIDDESNFANGVAHATVQGQASVVLDAEDQSTVVDRGGTSTMDVLVRNLGTGPTWFELSPSFETSGWSGRILTQQGDVVSNRTILVPEQNFQRIQLEVTAPGEVPRGHEERVTLTARAVGQAQVSDEIGLTAEIHDFDIDVSLTGPIAKDAAPGDNVEYRLNITNRGNGPDRVQLAFEGPDGQSPRWAVSSDLADDTTPELAPGETLEGTTVEVAVPSPNQGPVPQPDGLETVIRATSQGGGVDGSPPTVTTSVVTRLVKYVRVDVDGDTAFEVALDLNRDSSDGFEVFGDRDVQMIERGELSQSDSVRSEGLYVFDGEGDDRIEHIIDTDGDGIGDVYLDPDRAQTYTIPYTVDANRDDQPDHPIDGDFDGLIDGVYDPASDSTHETVHLDFSGDGRRDLLIDVDDDTFYDTFVDPNQSPHIVTPVDRDDDTYKLDTDDNGRVDTHYNAQTQSIEEAATANLETFLGDYWYFIILFVLVIAAFAVIVVRRL